MASGHTDRATINARKPLTPGMAALLGELVTRGRLSGHRFDQAEKSQARGLMDRGYAIPDHAGWWTATETGIAEHTRLCGEANR